MSNDRQFDEGLGKKTALNLEMRAIAKGWLKRADGLGLDEQKMAAIASKCVQMALSSTDARAVAACTRNVVAMVEQVMEQEKRDAGGEQLNVNVNGTIHLTPAERRSRITAICRAALERAGIRGDTPAPDDSPN